jgi:hypothetical protein
MLLKPATPKRYTVAEANAAKLYQGGQHAPVVVYIVGDQEVDVLSSPDEAIGNDGKAADYDKAGNTRGRV